MLSPITVVPLYEKVKEQLLTYIEAEKPKVLPCEKDLIKLFCVSRNTVRHAVQDLSNSGVLKPIQGRGTIVLKYAEDKLCDIGVVCTDSLDVTEPWIASMIKCLREEAHAAGYHLNLFFCHDYSINSTNNSAYSYLVNSGKLVGLILLSVLKSADVKHLKSINLPFVTVDFEYRTFEHAASLSNVMELISNSIDKYVSTGIQNFGVVAKCIGVLNETKCQGGINDLIIENWESILNEKNLPVPGGDFKQDIADQVRIMHALPPAQRPQVIFSPYIAHNQEVATTLLEFPDWNPIHVKSAMKGYKTDGPVIILDPTESARKALTMLHDIITNDQTFAATNRKLNKKVKF